MAQPATHKAFHAQVESHTKASQDTYAFYHKKSQQMYYPRREKQTQAVNKHAEKAQKAYAYGAVPIAAPIALPIGAYHMHKMKAALGAPRIGSSKPRTPKY